MTDWYWFASNDGDSREVVASGVVSYLNLVPGAGISIMGGTLNYQGSQFGIFAYGFSAGVNLGAGMARIQVLANPETFNIEDLMKAGYQSDFGGSIVTHSRSSSNNYHYDFEIRMTGLGYSYPFVTFSLTPFGRTKIVKPGPNPTITDLYKTRPRGY